jgi:2-phosphoglycerate kinase
VAGQGEARRGSGRDRSGRIWVADGDRRRPFMRGIMIHSLMARGVPFEDAYLTANTIRDRLRGRERVTKEEIAKAVHELLGDAPFAEERARALAPDIGVVGAGGSHPFSKGILSQSLLAAALEPNEAFDVARSIERTLLERGVREIERSDLRRLTYETLGSEVSAQTAERYLVWRRYQEPDRPVIILLGGATGVGKTSLALEVAHRLGIGRVLSTDSIRQIMRIMLSPELVPAIHASSYDAYLTLPALPPGEDPVIAGFNAQSATVSVGIRASVDRAVAENASLVLDGVSIAPGLIDLDRYRDRADVFFLVVATLDEDALRSRFAARAETAKERPAQRYLENVDAILKIQDHFLDLADRHDVPIVDNVSLDRSVLFIIRHVSEALRQRGDFDAADLL